MASPSVLVMAFLSLLIIALLSFAGTHGEVSKWREFDYFALALQWPGTVCRGTRHCCSYNACCRGSNAPSEFTIHGLWPDYNDGSWPACCSHSRFDIKEISSLLGALEKYWPSLSCGSPSTCDGHKGTFLAHEWEKHGTCSYPVIRNEYDYFLTTLNVNFRYNVTKVLSEAGYVASDSEKYPLGGIVSAIENAFHASPQVVCSGNDVEELRLCFYKDFKSRRLVSAFSREVEQRDRIIADLEEENAWLDAELAEAVGERHEEMAALEAVLAGTEAESASLRAEVARLKEENDQLKASNKRLADQAAASENELTLRVRPHEIGGMLHA